MASWRCLCGLPLITILVALVAIGVPLLNTYNNLLPDESFALMKEHVAIVNPSAYHARYRMDEYAHLDNYFFQWWNFLVFDSETRHHYNFIYVLTNFSSGSSSKDTASVSMAHFQQSRLINAVTDTRPLNKALINRHADVIIQIHDTQGNVQSPYSMIFDDSKINIRASFDKDMASDLNTITEWDITFDRVHGVYLSSSTEKSNSDSKEMCLVVSNLFAYNSIAEGHVKENNQVYSFNHTNRFRAYAAGSWGCLLPTGDPPVSYPWTWFWIVIPSAFPVLEGAPVGSGDLSFVFGTARFQSPILGSVYGMYSITGLPPSNYTPTGILSTQRVEIFHNTSFQIPLMASSSDHYLSTYHVKLDNWTPYSDDYGSAVIPLIQVYTVDSRCHRTVISFASEISQYFRAPVAVEKDLRLRVFSDFRAVGVSTEIKLVRKGNCVPDGLDQILYEGHIDTMNALEFAYEPNMDIQKWSSFSGKIRE